MLILLFCLLWLAIRDIDCSPTAVVDSKYPEAVVVIERDDNANNADELDRVVKIEQQRSGGCTLWSLVTDVIVVVDKARPASEGVVNIGGSQFHPGEIGRGGFIAVSWVEMEFWIGRNRLATGRPRGHDMVEVILIRE
jgi:hypothetical protein